MSRLKEDVLYRVYGQPHSSITVAGEVNTFIQYGHNFLTLEARTGSDSSFYSGQFRALAMVYANRVLTEMVVVKG